MQLIVSLTDFETYPKVFAADKNYYVDMKDVCAWEGKIETYGIGKKGRRTEQVYEREHSESFKSAQKFRAGYEGTISVLKRVFGLEWCVYRSFKSFASAIGRLVFSHNLVFCLQGDSWSRVLTVGKIMDKYNKKRKSIL